MLLLSVLYESAEERDFGVKIAPLFPQSMFPLSGWYLSSKHNFWQAWNADTEYLLGFSISYTFIIFLKLSKHLNYWNLVSVNEKLVRDLSSVF